MQYEIVTGAKDSRENPVKCHAVVEAQSADDALLAYANAHRPGVRTRPYETWEQAAQDSGFPFAAARAVPIEWYEPEVREATTVELQEYSRAFGLLGELDDAGRERDRLAAACRQSTGTERESNMRQLREAEADVRRIECELSGASGGKATDEETGSKRIGDELAALGDAAAVEFESERAKAEPARRELTAIKRAALINTLSRRYPALESALNRGEAWATACRVPKGQSPAGKQGWYYLELIEAECRARYDGAAPAPAVAADLSPAGQLLHCINR